MAVPLLLAATARSTASATGGQAMPGMPGMPGVAAGHGMQGMVPGGAGHGVVLTVVAVLFLVQWALVRRHAPAVPAVGRRPAAAAPWVMMGAMAAMAAA
jgi:hypothetical protein